MRHMPGSILANHFHGAMRSRRNSSRNTAEHESLKAITETRGTNEDAVSAPFFGSLWQLTFGIAFAEFASHFDTCGTQNFD
jgi:hypothetical protein